MSGTQRPGRTHLVAGGLAMISAGLPRTTGGIDLVIDPSLENEARVYDALSTLPDGCVRELKPGEVAKHLVVRVADEVLVDLMAKASGIDYEEASQPVTVRELDGVPIPFANFHLLWRMKMRAKRDKDMGDLALLRDRFRQLGRTPPDP